MTDQQFLDEAVRLSVKGMQDNAGGPFGAIVVSAGTVVGRGCNRVTSSLDPTAHAEVVAIRDACSHLNQFSLEGAVLYTSCEPCPMCLSAAYWARIERIVYANTREDAAAIGFDDAIIYDQIPLPPSERSIGMIHVPDPQASAAFEAWARKTDRVEY